MEFKHPRRRKIVICKHPAVLGMLEGTNGQQQLPPEQDPIALTITHDPTAHFKLHIPGSGGR